MRPQDSDLEPVNAMLLVRPDPEPPNIGMIALPENANQVGNSGVIVKNAVTHPAFRPGRRVIFKPFTGTTLTVDGEDVLLLSPDDVLCFVNVEELPNGSDDPPAPRAEIVP